MLTRESPVARFVAMILLLVALVLFGAMGIINHLSERARLRAELRTSTEVTADQLVASLALPAWNFDQPQLDKIAESVMHDREAEGVIVRMHDVSSGGGFRTYGLVRDAQGVGRPVTTYQPVAIAGGFSEERPIVANGEQVGSLTVFYTPKYMEEELRGRLLYQVAAFVAFGVVLTASLYVLLWRTVVRPLKMIEQYAGAVSSGGNARPTGRKFRGELERLRGSIEKMVDLLAARYASLKQNESQLASQLRFEELVARISAQLVGAQPDNLHASLTRALEDIGQMLEADRVVLGHAEVPTGEMVARAHYRRTDPPFPERLVISARYPHMWRVLCDGQVSRIRDVAALDDDQAVDRKHFQEIGIRSQVAAPVLVEGQLRFMLAVASVERTMDWSDDAVARIKVLAELLATAALRCEAEEVVQSSERQFRTFIERAPVPIILVPAPPPDRSPIYFNPAFTRVFGFTRDDVRRPEDWWPLIYPDETYRAARRSAWEASLATIHESGGFRDTEEAEMHTKEGETRYAQVRLTLVEGYRMSFINDLTARRQAETALRLTQYAVDHNPVMIFRISMDGRFEYANDAACTQFGYTPAEIMHMHIWDIARTTTAEDWAERAANLRAQESTSLESVYVTKSGKSFPVEVRIQYVEFSGAQQLFAYAYDITDRKAAQEAEHAYTRRIQKLATELTRAEERQRRELATILHDGVGQNLFAATTQLLTMRHGEEGSHAEVDKALSLLDQVTRDTRELTFELCPPVLYQLGLIPALQRLADQFTARYGIACTIRGETTGPADLNARGLAYQAVRELLNNTAKHAGAKHVTISTAEVDDEGGLVQIEVADDGAGFDPALLKPGTGGFGLFHLRERIELFGGSLTIYAAPRRGCRVQLSVPLNALQSTE